MKIRTSILLSSGISRRIFLTASIVAPLGVRLPSAQTQDQLVDPATLKPGEFRWNPERSPEGPVVVLASIPKQWVVVYRNGIQIAASTCSTGRPGHRTPAGVFVILEKDKAPVRIDQPEKPIGTHAFTLTGPDSDPAHLKWLAFGLSAGTDQAFASALLASETIKRIDLAPDAAKRMTSLLHPGSTMVITDVHSADEHRTGPGFTILTHDNT